MLNEYIKSNDKTCWLLCSNDDIDFFFAAASVRGLLITLCGAALSVSMFAAIAQLLLEGSAGATAQKISTWCLRSTAIVIAIVVIGGFGIENIIKVFSRG